eukprot:scaffold78276_cov65-Phaeocystis_antarctica.AAC.3
MAIGDLLNGQVSPSFFTAPCRRLWRRLLTVAAHPAAGARCPGMAIEELTGSGLLLAHMEAELMPLLR